MKRIFQYIMLVFAAMVAASCTSDIENATVTADKNNMQFVIGNFPAFTELQTRAIGTLDEGKTSWQEGDEILIKLENSEKFGTQVATLVKTAAGWSLKEGQSLHYREGEAVVATAFYAPGCRPSDDGTSIELNDGAIAGESEYISVVCKIPDYNTIKIPFDKATRSYSRLRIATIPDMDITVSVDEFIPAGTNANKYGVTYALHSDAKGNAYLYGTIGSSSYVTVKSEGAVLATYSMKPTEALKSYVLDATAVTANSADEIKAAIAQKIADGKTDIRLNLPQDAGDEMFTAIRESLAGKTNGSISLVLMGCEQVPAKGLSNDGQFDALKSVSLPNVKTIGAQALKDCTCLEEICAPNVSKIDELAFEYCNRLCNVTFGELTEVRGSYNSNNCIFQGCEPIVISLCLSGNQKVLTEKESTDGSTYYWTSSDMLYKSSSDCAYKKFLGKNFKSVTFR